MVKGTLYATGRHAPRGRRARRRRPASMKWVYAMDEGERAARWRPASALGPRPVVLDRRQGRRAHHLRHDRLPPRAAERQDRPADRRRSATNGIVDLKVGVVYRQANGKCSRADPREGRNRPALDADRRQRHDHRRLVDGRRPRLRLQRTTRRASSARSTCGPASSSGASTRFRARASSATRRGRTARGTGPATPACGPQITVDPEAGLVYLPVETPTIDDYGGNRPGNNLFAESLVAVDLKTGSASGTSSSCTTPLWDHDLSSAPLLMDVTIDGKPRKIVGAADQAGLALRVRPHHRRADLADRGEAGAAVRRARREDVADAAVPDQAAAVLAHLRRRPTTSSTSRRSCARRRWRT